MNSWCSILCLTLLAYLVEQIRAQVSVPSQDNGAREIRNATTTIPITSCSANCWLDPKSLTLANIYSWTPVDIWTTATAEVIYIVNKRTNSTRTTTSYEVLPTLFEGDIWETFEPRTNEAGTATFSSGSVVLTYPTPHVSFNPEYTFYGTIPTEYDGKTTCIAGPSKTCAYIWNYPLTWTFKGKPQISTDIPLPAEDDPGGLMYTIQTDWTSLPVDIFEPLTRDEEPFRVCATTTPKVTDQCVPGQGGGATANQVALYLTVTSTSIEADNLPAGGSGGPANGAVPEDQERVPFTNSVEMASLPASNIGSAIASIIGAVAPPALGSNLGPGNGIPGQAGAAAGQPPSPQVARPGAGALVQAASQTLSPQPGGGSTVDTSTGLSAGTSDSGLGNQILSGLGRGEAVGNGQFTTIRLPTGATTSLVFTGSNGQVITATRPPGGGSGTLVANGVTLSVGGPARTIDGQVASLTPDGLVVGGSTPREFTGSASRSIGRLSVFRLIHRILKAVSFGGL